MTKNQAVKFFKDNFPGEDRKMWSKAVEDFREFLGCYEGELTEAKVRECIDDEVFMLENESAK